VKNTILIVLAVILGSISAQAIIYTDAIDEAPDEFDITQVEVTNDATNLYFMITLATVGLASDEWARFGFGIDSVTNGATTADAWNDKIIMSSGMDFWGGGWTVQGTNSSGLNVYDASLGGWPEWENGGDGSTWVYYWGPEFSSNTISFGVSLATLGLSAGDSFDFDVYTFWNDGYPSDALGLSGPILWEQYDSGTNVVTYTVEAVGPVYEYGDPATAFISLDGTDVVIDFLAESNVAYYVQSVTNLPGGWSNISSLIVGDGTTNSTSYPVDSDEKYFKVIQP
jgi:hypothetical protein